MLQVIQIALGKISFFIFSATLIGFCILMGRNGKEILNLTAIWIRLVVVIKIHNFLTFALRCQKPN